MVLVRATRGPRAALRSRRSRTPFDVSTNNPRASVEYGSRLTRALTLRGRRADSLGAGVDLRAKRYVEKFVAHLWTASARAIGVTAAQSLDVSNARRLARPCSLSAHV